jgi:hypothetical protein
MVGIGFKIMSIVSSLDGYQIVNSMSVFEKCPPGLSKVNDGRTLSFGEDYSKHYFGTYPCGGL